MDLDEWLTALSAELSVQDFAFDNNTIHTVLDLARDAAHEVARPAAPLTTFLLGLAVGRGAPLGAAAAKATALAMRDHHHSNVFGPEDDSPES
ncbi:MAG: hypothetical protein QOF52_185 [Propionibacteriaceae bacterium]|jgi:hypothetical protein|nr:molybdopterin-guanine dinucleotide biosynthesis protein [Propionibacteriaceae bacterium]MDX6320327.1 hypothetical protein [Propionibacteriaceae bacterium]